MFLETKHYGTVPVHTLDPLWLTSRFALQDPTDGGEQQAPDTPAPTTPQPAPEPAPEPEEVYDEDTEEDEDEDEEFDDEDSDEES